MALDCPGTSDYTCPHWDHTVQLYLCCNKSSDLCGKEIGRWITPFRRYCIIHSIELIFRIASCFSSGHFIYGKCKLSYESSKNKQI